LIILSYPGFGRHHLVRKEEELETIVLEDVLKELDDLQGQDVLSTIITDLRSKVKTFFLRH
jgi:hypothetical protein